TREATSTFLGTVEFDAGKLIRITKSWRNQAETALEFGEALYWVGAHFVEENRTRCTLSVFQNEVPNLRLKTTSMTCGRKELRISVSRHTKDFADSVELEEILR